MILWPTCRSQQWGRPFRCRCPTRSPSCDQCAGGAVRRLPCGCLRGGGLREPCAAGRCPHVTAPVPRLLSGPGHRRSLHRCCGRRHLPDRGSGTRGTRRAARRHRGVPCAVPRHRGRHDRGRRPGLRASAALPVGRHRAGCARVRLDRPDRVQSQARGCAASRGRPLRGDRGAGGALRRRPRARRRHAASPPR